MTAIAFINNKGGTAKTLSAVTTAACLAREGHSVTLIDADPARGATKSFGLEASGEAGGAGELFTMTGPVEVETVKSSAGVDVVVGSPDLANFTLRYGPTAQREHIFGNRLTRYRKEHPADYILVDCPPDISLLTVNVLVGVDYFVVPVRPNYLDTVGLADLLATVWTLRGNMGSVAAFLGALLVDVPRTSHARQMSLSVRRQLKDQVFATEIPRSARLAEAAGVGKTALEHAPTSPGADAYVAFSREMSQRVKILSAKNPTRKQSKNPGGKDVQAKRLA